MWKLVTKNCGTEVPPASMNGSFQAPGRTPMNGLTPPKIEGGGAVGPDAP